MVRRGRRAGDPIVAVSGGEGQGHRGGGRTGECLAGAGVRIRTRISQEG